MFFNRMRYFNKNVLNKFMLKIAGTGRNSFAVVRHIGRRSGKTYETPIIVVPDGESFVIALTYGNKVDWYRNVQAAGGATLLWHGTGYEVGKPEPMERNSGLQYFSAFQRFILRMTDIQHFVRVRIVVSQPASA